MELDQNLRPVTAISTVKVYEQSNDSTTTVWSARAQSLNKQTCTEDCDQFWWHLRWLESQNAVRKVFYCQALAHPERGLEKVHQSLSIIFQIWHKPTGHLWKTLLTDTNSFRLWKDEKVSTRQCLLHYLLPCIGYQFNRKCCSGIWGMKNGNMGLQKGTEK